jgi:hypothetical protein
VLTRLEAGPAQPEAAAAISGGPAVHAESSWWALTLHDMWSTHSDIVLESRLTGVSTPLLRSESEPMNVFLWILQAVQAW